VVCASLLGSAEDPVYARVLIRDCVYLNVRQEQLPWNKDDSGGTPQKTRADDLSAFLSGQGAVYASPNWQKEWSGQRFLPDVKDRTGSAVLLPAAAMREQRAKEEKERAERKAKEDREKARRRERSPSGVASSLGGVGGENKESGAATGAGRPVSATRRPVTPSAEQLLERERSHNQSDRPRTPTVNLEAMEVKRQHEVLRERERGGAAARPESAQSRPASASVAKAKPPPGSAVAKAAGGADGNGKAGAAGKGGRGAKAGGKGGKDKEGGAGAEDTEMVQVLRAELAAVRADRDNARVGKREQEAEVHRLRMANLELVNELGATQDRQRVLAEEIDGAREANQRFSDVQKLLQLSEEERVKLIERVETLTEEGKSWRPVQEELETRVVGLIEQCEAHGAEVSRLHGVEDELRTAKDASVASAAQLQSWQEMCTELQEKVERWEGVKDSLERQLVQAQADLRRARLEAEDAERARDKYRDMLEDLGVDVPDEEELGLSDDDDEFDDMDVPQPQTRPQVMKLLTGQIPDSVVPHKDTHDSENTLPADVPVYDSGGGGRFGERRSE